MNQKLYHENLTFCKPIVTPVRLSSNRCTSVITFPLQDIILRTVTDKSLFQPSNLLLDPDNPCKRVSNPSEIICDVNDGSWFVDSQKNELTKEDQILMPFSFFIDGLKVDKFGKLTMEAVLGCCLWFNKKARNRSSTWFVLGFVQDQKLFRDQDNYIRDEKAQDYHDMLAHIFQEMRLMREKGGIRLTLDFGQNRIHVVTAIPVIQFIVGDCKGNDLLCGRMGGHNIEMGGLCRDCDVSPSNGDLISDGDLPNECNFHTMEYLQSFDRKKLKKISFLPINNSFHHISFGGCERNIYGGTPAEILHAVELGLCEYIADSLTYYFSPKVIEIISTTIAGIVKISKRQSERDLPELGPFKQGLISVKLLKASERFARVYALHLALMNSHCVKELCSRK